MKLNTVGLLLGLVVLAAMLLLPLPPEMPPVAMRAAAVTLLMTIWWITEAIPIYATSFVPLALFPLLGILEADKTAENYGHNYVLMTLLVVVALVIFLTEINSNTATANIFLPVLATMAVARYANPLLLMIPATFACSFAFMLPSGTGTNAAIFASGRVTIPEMARCGLWLNLISIGLLTLILYLVVIPLFGIGEGLPEWGR
jgi:di/tricarboxylate transporter